jgi:uncharacterized membrane-anchored protein
VIFLLDILLLALVSMFVFAGRVAALWEAGITRFALAGQGLLSGGAGIYLAFYVAGEDEYRADGTSRWDAYDAHGVTVAAVAVAIVVSVLAVLLAARPRKRFLPALGLAGLVGAGLLFVALFANSLN